MRETEPESQAASLPEWSVSELSAALKRTVEDRFARVRVRGEISGLKFHSSGHVYFDLKDELAVLNAVIWRGTAQRLKIKPEGGLDVVCTGKLSTYVNSSRYQLIVERIELAGLGAIMAMLEARRIKLATEGLFDVARKKPLPFLPEVVGVITSPTGAVIRDILHRLADRCPRRVLLWPVAVQGERAASELVAAIAGFNALEPGVPSSNNKLVRPDVLIVARGGGSVEDLMAFNDEAVVRAAAASSIPLISAVGHETDTTLIDFAADRRAPTPSAAAEMAVPVRRELAAALLSLGERSLRAAARLQDRASRQVAALARALPRADFLFALPRQRLDASSSALKGALVQNLHRRSARLTRTASLIRPASVMARLPQGRERCKALAARLAQTHGVQLRQREARLTALVRLLDSVSYRRILARGFALVRDAGGHVKRRAAAIGPGEALTLAFADGETDVVAGAKPGSSKPGRAPKVKPGQGDLF